LAEAVSLETFSGRVDKALQRAPIAIAGSDRPVRRIAWCSGAAQGYIEQAASLGVDLYLSGEISEQTTHLSRELGIHYVAAGHHATERYGAQALGAHLAQELAIEHLHIDIDNPA
jgi:putative NIF3 family GTP cyclohydrolase 1 type 2